MLEKLQGDGAQMLLNGANWKMKRKKHVKKDNRCVEVAEQLKNGKIRTKKYLEIVINTMGDYS